jgi:catechol 2,3-dioxygenase-like lactoylglutathione lyase family enzyme
VNAIRGIYEVAVKVKDLKRAEAFYCDALGLSIGARDERRPWLFLRAGGQAGMLVLQEDLSAWAPQHFAFTARDDELEPAAASLRARGILVHGPVLHEWMPARSIYFKDPDGNELELCAPLGTQARG